MLGEEQGAEASAAAVLSWAAGGRSRRVLGAPKGSGAGTGVPSLLGAGNFKKNCKTFLCDSRGAA